MAPSTTAAPAPAASLPFMRRRSSAAMAPAGATTTTTPPDADAALQALTAFFLPEAAPLAVDAVPAELTESLLAFDVADERLEEEEYLKYDLPESILPMSPEPSPRARSASALSTAAIESAAAALTSWFSYEDFERDENAVEDEAVDEMDEDFLRDDYMQVRPRFVVVEQEEEETMPTPAKLSLIAEEDFAKTVASVQPWAARAFAWPWVRAN